MKGYFLIACAAALWGMIGPISKLAFREGVSPMEVAFFRAILAWFFFALHAGVKREMSVRRKDLPLILVFGIMGVTVFYVAYQLAVKSGGAALASVLLYTAPAWVAVMSRVFFAERMTPKKGFALLLTLAGVAAISLGAGSGTGPAVSLNLSALFFGLLSGFSYSLYYILGKHFSDRYSSPNLFLYMLPIGALFMLPWVQFSDKSPLAWASLILLAFLCTYSAYLLYYMGLKYLEATRAVITATLEPVIAAGIAFLWWGEYFTPAGYIGSAMILTGVVLMVREGAG